MGTAIFGIPFSLELALKLSELINCRRCGKCCRESKIFVSKEEIKKIAQYLEESKGKVKIIMSVKDGLTTPPCSFWDNGCSIYKARPVNCRLFPMFQYSDGRLACSLECQAGKDMHNLLSREKL